MMVSGVSRDPQTSFHMKLKRFSRHLPGLFKRLAGRHAAREVSKVDAKIAARLFAQQRNVVGYTDLSLISPIEACLTQSVRSAANKRLKAGLDLEHGHTERNVQSV
jgi:hypothetical protein